jgi:hypothetical protein
MSREELQALGKRLREARDRSRRMAVSLLVAASRMLVWKPAFEHSLIICNPQSHPWRKPGAIISPRGRASSIE